MEGFIINEWRYETDCDIFLKFGNRKIIIPLVDPVHILAVNIEIRAIESLKKNIDIIIPFAPIFQMLRKIPAPRVKKDTPEKYITIYINKKEKTILFSHPMIDVLMKSDEADIAEWNKLTKYCQNDFEKWYSKPDVVATINKQKALAFFTVADKLVKDTYPSVTFCIRGERLYAQCKGDYAKMEADLTEDGIDNPVIISGNKNNFKYSLPYLLGILKHIKSDTLTLKLRKNEPLSVDWEDDEWLAGHAILAPILEG